MPTTRSAAAAMTRAAEAAEAAEAAAALVSLSRGLWSAVPRAETAARC
jgi:hypothetical protein